MKKFILLNIVLLSVLSGCKKGDQTNAAPEITPASIKSDILGTWYYKAFSVDYYYETTELIYVVNSTAKDLYNDPTFQFNSDGTGSYEGVTFDYKVTITAGADSLIFSNGNTSRFAIVKESPTDLTLLLTYPATVPFTNINTGQVVYSNIAISHPALSRVRAPQP